MKPENPLEVVLLVASMATLISLMVVVVRQDERRLDEAALERAWLPSSRDSALIGLSLLGSPLLGLFGVFWHFWRTRRWHPKGFLLGLGFAAAILVVDVVAVTALAWALGLPLDD
ncbi:MAG TPA: hypothetical protein VIF62_08005 [Labilithrix sp.]